MPSNELAPQEGGIGNAEVSPRTLLLEEELDREPRRSCGSRLIEPHPLVSRNAGVAVVRLAVLRGCVVSLFTVAVTLGVSPFGGTYSRKPDLRALGSNEGCLMNVTALNAFTSREAMELAGWFQTWRGDTAFRPAFANTAVLRHRESYWGFDPNGRGQVLLRLRGSAVLAVDFGNAGTSSESRVTVALDDIVKGSAGPGVLSKRVWIPFRHGNLLKVSEAPEGVIVINNVSISSCGGAVWPDTPPTPVSAPEAAHRHTDSPCFTFASDACLAESDCVWETTVSEPGSCKPRADAHVRARRRRQCNDDPSYTSPLGNGCASIARVILSGGLSCDHATDVGYTQAEEDELFKRCPKSCGRCPPKPCADDPGYVSPLGNSCDAIAFAVRHGGLSCDSASTVGYTEAEEEELFDRCPLTCGVCRLEEGAEPRTAAAQPEAMDAALGIDFGHGSGDSVKAAVRVRGAAVRPETATTTSSSTTTTTTTSASSSLAAVFTTLSTSTPTRGTATLANAPDSLVPTGYALEASSTTTSTSSSSSTSSTTSSGTTSTTTTSTSSTSHTSTLTTITTVTFSPNSLYCWALIIPYTYEQTLLNIAQRNKAGIFACSESDVYSNEELQVAPGVQTVVVNTTLKCERGGQFKTVLNRAIFQEVWKEVVHFGRYKNHDWTVKADADAVFLPERLQKILLHHPVPDNGVYLNNCKFGMHGPIEVFSKTAVEKWVRGADRCVAHFHKLCDGPCLWGEDLFIDQCLSRVLDVRRDNETNVLLEDHCDPPDGWDTCGDVTKAAFHPFKTIEGYTSCLRAACMCKVHA